MTAFQSEKAVARAYHADLATATAENVAETLSRHTDANWHWRGMHPFHEQHGAAAVAQAFSEPFLTAMSRVQRRPDI